MRAGASWLCVVLVAACDLGGGADPTVEPTPAPEPAGPPPLEILIEPDVRAWDEGGDDLWAVEGSLTLVNRGDAPFAATTSWLRLRDQESLLHASWEAELDHPIRPGGRAIVDFLASRNPRRTGRPTRLRVDYGNTATGMTPEVSAPVVAASTEGLVATEFVDPHPPRRVFTSPPHPREPEPMWSVRLAMEVHNPTDRLVRMPLGGLVAFSDTGPAVWGDISRIEIDDPWIPPGRHRRARVVLAFRDAPDPPARLQLSYAGGDTTTLDLPVPEPVEAR